MYFVTICTQNRRKILSKIENAHNEEINNCKGKAPSLPKNTIIGNIIEKTIEFINENYCNININPYVIMPNHVHMVIEIMGKDGALPLQDVVRIFKTFTANKYWKISNNEETKLWQRNYYEHIIRNEKEY